MPAPIVTHANAFVSRWSVKPEKREEFIAAFNALWQGAADQMAEVTNFVFYGWGRDENEFVAIESWKSEEIVAMVRQSEGFKTAVTHLLSCSSKPMVMEVYSPWEGARSVFDIYPAGPSQVHPASGAINAVFV
ncbi:hypothetical protein GCM10010909_01270 [Acidocella aquatica]|uniref:ABM domain-containing protein n=1 Tax=Acidocella aquatica TaxID=1922313 RepID=A0ABQ5ZZT0_9PROT|nr:antibiotic biosynthesis monooxygenase [Acidocella aquatica]GLR65449.1 hypothetical protein GCM10010909_01270 [Acidocella aquatica]